MIPVFHVTVTCGCKVDGSHTFPMIWSENRIGGPISPPEMGQENNLKAFHAGELPAVLEAIADWMRSGGIIMNIAITPVPTR